MADNFNFKIDPSDYRGIEHEEFRTNLLNLLRFGEPSALGGNTGLR